MPRLLGSHGVASPTLLDLPSKSTVDLDATDWLEPICLSFLSDTDRHLALGLQTY